MFTNATRMQRVAKIINRRLELELRSDGVLVDDGLIRDVFELELLMDFPEEGGDVILDGMVQTRNQSMFGVRWLVNDRVTVQPSLVIFICSFSEGTQGGVWGKVSLLFPLSLEI